MTAKRKVDPPTPQKPGLSSEAAELFFRRMEKKKRSKMAWGYLRIPETVEIYEPEPGTAMFDIVPYQVKSEKNEYVEPGHLWFEKTYWVHYGIGVEEKAYICPSRTERERCPICEYKQKLFNSGDKNNIEIAKTLRPKERQLFWTYHPEEKKLKLLAMSYHLFGRILEEEVENSDDPSVAGFWAADATGKTLRVRWARRSMGGGREFIEAARIDFMPRKYTLKSPKLSLDEVLEILPYEELKKAFFDEMGAEPDGSVEVLTTDEGGEYIEMENETGPDEDEGENEGGVVEYEVDF